VDWWFISSLRFARQRSINLGLAQTRTTRGPMFFCA
jgi:hypothetical protein